MANPSSMNMNQDYYWNPETAQQNMEYYPVPNYPPPNYNQSSSYDQSSYSYNASHVSEVDAMYRSVPPSTYHTSSSNIQNVSYQNQVDQQCNIYQHNNMNFPQQPVNYNVDWSTNARSTYNENQVCNNEWPSNSSTNWSVYQNTPNTSWYDPNKTYNGNDSEKQYVRQQYESQQQKVKPEWKYDAKESSPNYTSSKNRSRSPSSSGRSEKLYRSRYEDHRDKYHKYDKERSRSREYKYKSKDSEKRSSYRKRDSSQTRTSRSETPHTSSKCRKRSRSQESYASRDVSQISNSVKRKCPTERELLLEKYR